MSTKTNPMAELRRLANKEIVNSIPARAQRQDSTMDQLETLLLVANRIGCYDAADFLKSKIKQKTNDADIPFHEGQLVEWRNDDHGGTYPAKVTHIANRHVYTDSFGHGQRSFYEEEAGDDSTRWVCGCMTLYPRAEKTITSHLEALGVNADNVKDNG